MDLLKHGFVGGVGTQDITLRRRIHANYPEIPVFFINKTLQICRPPESLRKKVNKELIDKYAPKTLNKEEEITIEQKAVDDDGDEQKSQENENISDNNESDKE
ncbi:hypothetical protein GPJ56_003327 [Histomonas meleagridis]|uniref:uncharacterized protein n=1 Tax=Histomonas meleagridis TaxID=135588 RepID=UPI00355A9C8E|nr:hypothetical protein GPJ56_003327 [Histomonas meleagridis]KAH0804946.1 hypothetical protein GO595_001891 [Histomonas meleagridis]